MLELLAHQLYFVEYLPTARTELDLSNAGHRAIAEMLVERGNREVVSSQNGLHFIAHSAPSPSLCSQPPLSIIVFCHSAPLLLPHRSIFRHIHPLAPFAPRVSPSPLYRL